MTIDIIEVNAETGETIERRFTAEEIAQREIDLQASIARRAAEEATILARQAVFNRLGLTEEEAQLILGGNN